MTLKKNKDGAVNGDSHEMSSSVSQSRDASAPPSEPTAPPVLTIDEQCVSTSAVTADSIVNSPINADIELAKDEIRPSAPSAAQMPAPDYSLPVHTEPPPTYDESTAAIAPQSEAFRTYEPPPMPAIIQNNERMPRTLTIAELYSSQPTRRSGYSIESFEVRNSLTQKSLYKIHRWKDTSLGSQHPRLCMELVRADNGTVLSRWATAAGFTSCICCCATCVPKHRRGDNFAPDYSLRIRSPSGSIEGHIKLVGKSIHVLGFTKEKLYKIACDPTEQNYQITRPDSSGTVYMKGSSMFHHQAARVRLPTTVTESHDILVLAGVFALHFMHNRRPGHIGSTNQSAAVVTNAAHTSDDCCDQCCTCNDDDCANCALICCRILCEVGIALGSNSNSSSSSSSWSGGGRTSTSTTTFGGGHTSTSTTTFGGGHTSSSSTTF